MLSRPKNIIIILILIILGGIFLRIYQLEKQPYWMDEGYTINAIISSIENGYSKGSSILDSGKKYFCPLYCYPSAKISQIIDSQPIAYRLLAVLFGVLFIILSYFLSQTFFRNQKVSLLATFLVSFSYWQIAWSRQARWYTMLAVFFWLSLFLFYQFLKNDNKKKKIFYFSLSLLSTLLAIISHKIAYLLPIIMLLWYFLEIKINKKKIILSILITSIIIALIELVLKINFLSQLINNISWNYNLPYYLSFYLRNYWPFILISIYGYFTLDQEKKKKIILLISPFLIYLLSLSLLSDIVHYRYLFHTTIAFFLISSLVIIELSKKLRYNYGKLLLIVFISLFFISGQEIFYPKQFYFLESDNPDKLHRPYYAYTPQPNFNAGYDKIKENIKPDEIIISSHPHFNKIFLNQAGYWIKYHYLGIDNTPNQTIDNKEYYVGAEIINNLEELKNLINNNSGYILFDYMSIDGRIDPKMIDYINDNLELFFYHEINNYSKIWIYKF